MASIAAGIACGAQSQINKHTRRSERRAQRREARLRRACFATATLLGSIAVSRVHAQTLYWDVNGTTANSGTTASQNWTSTSTFWNTSSTGTGGTIQAWSPGGSAVFSSGTNFTGTSNITLTGSQSVSTITFEEGTLNLTSNSALAGAIDMSGSSLTVTNSASGKTNSILVPITGAGGLFFANTSGGAAVINIDTQPQFQGNLDIGAGTSYGSTTRIQLGYNLANASAVINMRKFSELGNNNPVTDPMTGLSTPASYTVTNNINLNVDSVANCESLIGASNGRTVTYTGVISGTSNVNFAYNAGGGRGTVVLGNVETYVGDTFINLANNNGELRFGIANSLPTATNVTCGGTSATLSGTNAVGPIDLAGFSQQWASLASGTGAQAGIFNTGTAATLTIDGTRSTVYRGPIGKADSTIAPFNNAVSGTPNTNISLIKNNTSTLTLTASNAFTGDTTINGGTLVAGFASTLASTPSLTGNVNVNNTGALFSAGGSRNTSVYISGAVNVNSGGKVDPGGTDTGTLKPHDVFLNGGGHVQFDIQSTTDYDLMDIAGGFNLDGGVHTIDVGLSTRSGAAISAGSYLVAQYGSRNWDGTDGLTLGSTPGGAFNYSLDFQDNLLYLNVTPVGPTYRWSVGGTFPVTEGSGTWQDGQGNFIDLANSNNPANWSNAYTGDVIFGGDPNQTGGVITLGSNIVVSGTLRFSAIASPYTIGDGSNANTLTLGGDLFSDTSPTIAAPTIISGSGHTWTINTGQTLSMTGSLTQATGDTDSLTKAGSGVLAVYQPVTLNAINVTGGALESWADGALANVPTIMLDGNSALRAMAAQTIPGNITIGAGGAQLTVTGVAGTATMSGAITSTGNVTKQGGGTLLLTNNTNTISSWTLAGYAAGFQSQVAFSAPGAIGTGPIGFNGGGLQLLAAMTLTNNMSLNVSGHVGTGDGSRIDVGSNNATLTGVISGGGDLHKSGSGTLTIAGNNTYQGGALFIDTASTIVTTSASSLGAATVWPTTATTLDVETNMNTACFRGNGAITKIGPGLLNAGAVGGIPGGFNEGASITANLGNLEMSVVNAFGGKMDQAGGTHADTESASTLPQAAHAQYNITMNSGTELITNFIGTRYGGSVTLNNATLTCAASTPVSGTNETYFESYNTWQFKPSNTFQYTNYGASLTVTGSSTIRQLQQSIDSNSRNLAFSMGVNITPGSTLTVSNTNSGGFDSNNLIAFRGSPDSAHYDVVADAISIGAGAALITQGPGQIRFGRSGSEGKVIIAHGTPGSESLLRLTATTYTDQGGSNGVLTDANVFMCDTGSLITTIAVAGSGDAGLRIEAPMNGTYVDLTALHTGSIGLFNSPNGASDNHFTVMSPARLAALSASTGGTLTLAAIDPADATGLINSGPASSTPLALALDNTASSANSNLTYQIAPNANGMKFANFAGLTIKRSNAGTGTVVAQVQPRSVTGGNSPLRVKSLSIASNAALDLNDNDLVYAYGTNPTPFLAVRDQVFAGFSSVPDPSKRSSGGIISSSGQSAGNTILAMFDNALVGIGDWPIGSGITIDGNSVIGKYTYFGDMDLSGDVTADDYGILDANLGTTPPPGIAWLSGDADLSGDVTPDDYAILDANFGSGVGNPLAPAGASAGTGTVAVPEPSGLALVGAAGLLRRRRRKS